MASIMTCPACQGAIALPPGMLARLQCPHCGNELSLQATALADDDSAHAPPVIPRPARPRPAPTPQPMPQRATPQLATPQLAMEQPAEPPLAAYRQRLAQQKQRPSALGQLVGIMGGGLLGTVLGYYLLNYFGGPRYDFLNIALPGVPHTQVQAPVALPHEEEEVPPARMAADAPPSQPPPVERLPQSPVQPAVAILPAEPARPAWRFPSFRSDELGQALAAAHAAAGCEHCQSSGFIKRVEVTGVSEVGGRRIERKAERRLPCDVCGGKPTGKITPEVYAQLCHLSQVVTFVEIAPGDPQLLHRREAVEQVLLRAAADRDKQNALGRLAGYHLANPQRPSDGVLLAGTIQDIDREGEFYRTRMVLFGLPETVTIVSHGRPPLAAQDKALVAGSLLDNPREKLPGYAGSVPLVVWGGLPVKIPAER